MFKKIPTLRLYIFAFFSKGDLIGTIDYFNRNPQTYIEKYCNDYILHVININWPSVLIATSNNKYNKYNNYIIVQFRQSNPNL